MSALLKTTGRLAAGRMGGFNRQLLGVCGSMRYKSTTLRQTETSKDGHTTTTTLANGLRITSEHNPGHFTALGVYVDAGSRYEDGATAGYAHLMDRLAFRNSAQFTSSAAMAAIEKLGGSIMSSSTRECIMYQAAVFPQDAGLAMQLLADTTLRPRVLPEDIEELQATVPWELQDVASKPEMFLPEKLHETAFQTGTLGNPLLCPPMQLAQATPERLAKYHSRWYRPERMVVAAVGMEHEELVRLCDANGFTDLPRTEPQQKPKEPWITVPNGQAVYTGGTWFESKPDMEFTQVYLGFQSAGIADEQQLYAYAVLQMLLGGGGSFSAGGPGKGMYSRLYTRVLNQHAWIESCMAFHHCYSDSGLFGISASCGPRNEHALLDVIATEIEAVASGRTTMRRPFASQEGASKLEVRRAKNQLKSNLLMNLESRMVQLEDLARQIQVAGKKIPAGEMVERIEAITPRDVATAAARLLESPATLLAQGFVDGIKQFYPQVAQHHGIKI